MIYCLDLGNTKFSDGDPVTTPTWTSIDLNNGTYDYNHKLNVTTGELDEVEFIGPRMMDNGKVGGNYNRMPFKNNTFLYTWGTCYLEEEYDFKELFRVLKPGGIARVWACAGFYLLTSDAGKNTQSVQVELNRMLEYFHDVVTAAKASGFEYLHITIPNYAIDSSIIKGASRHYETRGYPSRKHRKQYVELDIDSFQFVFKKPKEV